MLSALATKSVGMRLLVPTVLHGHHRPLNASLNAVLNDNYYLFLTVSKLYPGAYGWFIHLFQSCYPMPVSRHSKISYILPSCKRH
jgi:hypothetical protein